MIGVEALPAEVVTLEGVSLTLGGRNIIRDVSFSVKRGENFFILGGSGAGKSTILRLIIGLLKPTSGRVLLLGKELSTLNPEELNLLRREVGFVFQYSALFDFMTVYDNVAFPLRLRGVSEEEIRFKVEGILRELEVGDYMEAYPYELSGGMRKRVALARAIISEPQLILYDEPTSGLDPVMADLIDEIISDFNRRGVTNVVVTHDVQSAVSHATRLAFIYKGQLRFLGGVEEALESDDPLLRSFLEKGLRGIKTRHTP